VTEVGVVEVGVVDTRLAAVMLSGRGVRVYMITYRVDVYRSRPIGAPHIPTGWAWSARSGR